MPAPTGEVDEQPITAAHLRELLTQLDAICPGGLQAPAGGTLTIAVTDAAGGLLASTRRKAERIARRGCPTHPDTGPGDAGCGCALLGRPPATDAYAPTAAQRRWTTTRDRTCRHPGRGNPAGWADLDHVLPHARGGETSCANLCCLCRRHHRLKTHARGWCHDLTPDGVLSVTTPNGVTRVSRPPGTQRPGLPLTGPRVLARAPHPPPAPDPADDPPPF
ncbi:HNH endonuclease [Geodermatophilus sp. SYSU D00703]